MLVPYVFVQGFGKHGDATGAQDCVEGPGGSVGQLGKCCKNPVLALSSFVIMGMPQVLRAV